MVRIQALSLLLGALLTIQGCSGTAGTATPPTPSGQGSSNVALTTVVSGLENPVDLQAPNDSTSRLFVLEQAGRIRILQNGALLPSAFLDITAKVHFASDENGLLGLAFHPGFAQNHRFFIHYDRLVNGQVQSVIAEYGISATDPNLADAASERIVLTVDQPFLPNHKGGQLAFGPDGMLYIGLGDGGNEGDPLGNGQNLQTLLGKILRINVDGATPYSVPADNPFVNGGGLPEIWAYGLRNPWRFSFDHATSRLFAADVGQDHFEEIDIIQRGGNYGWNIMEGFHCFNPPSGCNTTGLTLPIAEYDHSEGNAVIGGYVYHGSAVPSLQGKYVFGDLGTGKIWTLTENPPGTWTRTLLTTASPNVTSFGQDQAGELYVLELGGTVLRLAAQ